MFTSEISCTGEAEVLYHERPATMSFRSTDELGDRSPETAVAGAGRQPGQIQPDSDRRSDRVSVRADDPPGEMILVDVDRQHRPGPQIIESCAGTGIALPGGVEIPAPLVRVEADVVPDSAGGGLGGDLVPAVSEGDRR